ncbi:MAG TPA: LPS export ABC transporter periplasmic protein LptC [Pasteurellaceae bacterium]|nr:LPS export ABC transporter periplasmic protein LptC [Pasteurellaceae bacterium]
MINFRWTALLGVIALVLLAWYYSLNQQEDALLAGLIKSKESPEYIGQKMNTVVYSPTGKKQYLAVAEKVEYYNYDGHTYFTKPLIYLFEIENEKTQQKESWKLSADNAKLTKNNMLYLNGNVIAETLLPESKLQRVETESAVVNLTNQDINSDNAVKINGQNFTSTGLKLSGNLQQQIATLKEQVKTHYEINPH